MKQRQLAAEGVRVTDGELIRLVDEVLFSAVAKQFVKFESMFANAAMNDWEYDPPQLTVGIVSPTPLAPTANLEKQCNCRAEEDWA